MKLVSFDFDCLTCMSRSKFSANEVRASLRSVLRHDRGLWTRILGAICQEDEPGTLVTQGNEYNKITRAYGPGARVKCGL